MSASTSGAASLGTWLRSALGRMRDYARGVMGADAYEKYLDHHRAEAAAGRCAVGPLSERDFWRDKMDRQDARPEGRCC